MMTDLAFAIVIVALVLVTAPVWFPFLYLVGLMIVGVLAFALGMIFLFVLWLIDGPSKNEA